MKSFRTQEYKKRLRRLHPRIQETAQEKFLLFMRNPDAPALKRKCLEGQAWAEALEAAGRWRKESR